MKKIVLPTKDTTADVVILAHGAYPSEGTVARAILESAKRVVCTDGAAERFIDEGGTPIAIVGDGDSIDKHYDNYILVSEQQTNDLTKAFHYCLSKRWRNIIILGATGLREDHTLANISLLVDIYTPEAESVMMISDFGCFAASAGKAVYETESGQQVSVFTSRCATRVSAIGLKYPFPADELPMLWQGSLNEALGTEITVMSDSYVVIYRVF